MKQGFYPLFTTVRERDTVSLETRVKYEFTHLECFQSQ